MMENMNDLTAQLQQVLKDLQACEDRYSDILTRIAHGILIVDDKGKILFANPAAATILECTTDELLGRKSPLPTAAETAAEITVKTRSGNSVAVDIWEVEFEWDEKPARLIALHDITARKLAEEALRESEEKFSRAFMAVPSLLFIATLPYEKYVEVNEAFERTFGWRQEEIFERTLADFDIWDDPTERARVVRAIQEDGYLRDQEMCFRSKSGETFCGLLSAELMELCGVHCMIGIITNISERKRSEEALQNSEEKFSKAFLYAPGLLIVSSTMEEGRIIEVNDAFERVFKYKREEAIGRSALDLNLWVDPEDRIRVIQTLHERGEVRDCEIRFRDRDGNVFMGLYSATITEIGGEECLLSVLSDITERKRLEEEREQLLTQLDAVLNSIHEGVVISDLEGNVLTMNPAALAIYGFEKVEQVRRQLSELQGVFELFDLDGRPLPREQRPMLRVLRGERFSDCEVRVRRRDIGKSFIGSYSGTPVYNKSGEVFLAVTTMRDITDRKRSEEALRESEARFSSIFNMAPIAIAITTLADGRFVDINAAGERLTGYRRDELIGRTALEFNIWDDPLQRVETIEALLERGEVRDREMAMKNRGGGLFWGSFSAVVVDLKSEKYMLSLISDITERKQAEAEIEKLNTSLATRAAELEAANQELEAFSYTVSHDLRRPLTTINGYCQVIQELCSVALGQQCRGYLEEIHGGTLRMNQLIDALLKFSSMTRIELRRETVDISAMAQAVAAELSLAEPERRVTFRIAEGITVSGDINLLRLVVENLFGNAWKYTGQREEGVIEFGVTEIDGKPACFVRDNGAGFAMAEAERLFAPFQRLSGSAEFKGHGIGLATVERIIRRHGGRIWAEGEPEKGATFFFTLPKEGAVSG